MRFPPLEMLDRRFTPGGLLGHLHHCILHASIKHPRPLLSDVLAFLRDNYDKQQAIALARDALHIFLAYPEPYEDPSKVIKKFLRLQPDIALSCQTLHLAVLWTLWRMPSTSTSLDMVISPDPTVEDRAVLPVPEEAQHVTSAHNLSLGSGSSKNPMLPLTTSLPLAKGPPFGVFPSPKWTSPYCYPYTRKHFASSPTPPSSSILRSSPTLSSSSTSSVLKSEAIALINQFAILNIRPGLETLRHLALHSLAHNNVDLAAYAWQHWWTEWYRQKGAERQERLPMIREGDQLGARYRHLGKRFWRWRKGVWLKFRDRGWVVRRDGPMMHRTTDSRNLARVELLNRTDEDSRWDRHESELEGLPVTVIGNREGIERPGVWIWVGRAGEAAVNEDHLKLDEAEEEPFDEATKEVNEQDLEGFEE